MTTEIPYRSMEMNTGEDDTETTIFVPLHEVNQPDTTNIHKWSSLWTCDLESCCLSYIMPYHVIAKIGQHLSLSYTFIFLTYALFFGVLNFSISAFMHGLTPVCDNTHYTDWCFILQDKTECKQSYTIIDNERYLCEYNNDYQKCWSGNNVCITANDYNITWGSWIFLELISSSTLTIIHVYVRRAFRRKEKLPAQHICKDICLAVWCTTCSLAQQYRELIKEETETIEV